MRMLLKNMRILLKKHAHAFKKVLKSFEKKFEKKILKKSFEKF
jgi:hypothetical protein